MNRFPLNTTSKSESQWSRQAELNCRRTVLSGRYWLIPFLLPQRTQACGPFFTDAIFVLFEAP